MTYKRYVSKRDQVYSLRRFNNGMWPHGRILFIERDRQSSDLSQVCVLYERPVKLNTKSAVPVLTVNEEIHWKSYSSADNLAYFYAKKEYVWIGEEVEFEAGSSETETYFLSDFEGCWSSSAGGNSRWELE